MLSQWLERLETHWIAMMGNIAQTAMIPDIRPAEPANFKVANMSGK